MRAKIILILTIYLLHPLSGVCENSPYSKLTNETAESSQRNKTTVFSSNIQAQKIVKRHQFEDRGWNLAKQGLYEQALIQYREAQNPQLLNYDYEKPIEPIKKIYIRQGNFEKALEIVNELFEKQKDNEWLLLSRIEIEALIKARDTKNNKPIYDYMAYVKTKYPQYFPPKGYFTGMSSIYINDFIHLYDYMHDYDSGIAFMNELIKYHTQHPNKNHRSAHAKDVKEYTRVKEAWELDKKTGQHGHLQEVIRTSDVISW